MIALAPHLARSFCPRWMMEAIYRLPRPEFEDLYLAWVQDENPNVTGFVSTAVDAVDLRSDAVALVGRVVVGALVHLGGSWLLLVAFTAVTSALPHAEIRWTITLLGGLGAGYVGLMVARRGPKPYVRSLQLAAELAHRRIHVASLYPPETPDGP